MVKKDFSNWLAVSDIDGTLNDKLRRLPNRNREAVKRFVSFGGKFTLASSRNPQSMEKHIARLGVCDVPAVVINGAGIYDFKKNEMIFFSPISEEGTDQILETAKKFPSLDVIVVAKDTIYLVGTAYVGIFYVAADGLDHKRVKRFGDVPRGNWGKVIFSGLPSTVSKIRKSFLSLKDPDLAFTPSSAASFEVLARNTNKGTAVLKLAGILGIDPSHTAAVGDYFNDLDMLKSVGISACCAQAPKRLKDVCDFTVRSCNRGAVADFLERLEAAIK